MERKAVKRSKVFTEIFLKRYHDELITNKNIIDFLIDLKNSILSLDEDKQILYSKAIVQSGLDLKTNEFTRREIKSLINHFIFAKEYLRNNKGIFFNSKSKKYKEFSTFYPCDIIDNKNTWKTVEHFYQAKKATNEYDVKKIKCFDNPNDVRKYTRRIKSEEDFDLNKVEIMFKGCLLKFKIQKFKKLLIKTSFINLYNDNKKDEFWGYPGKNMLGKILEQIRFNVSPLSLKILNLG